MGLFSKNKKKSLVTTASKADVDDIFSRPVKYNNSDKLNTDVQINEMTSVAPKTFNGPRGINSKVLEKSMAELEIELQKREQRPPQKYSIDGISAKDMSMAELEFENTVTQIREKQSKVRYGRIAEATVDNIDEKVKALDEQYDYLVHGRPEVDYGFNTISEEEFNSVISQYDIEKAAERKAIIMKMPGLNEAQKAKIQEFFDNDVTAEPMDFVNTIPELKEKDLEKIRLQLEKIYALDNAEKPELKIESL